MKNLAMLAMLALGAATGSLVWAEHHEHDHQASWFDAEACEICRPMSKHPELMEAMKWETHKIKDGMLMVSMVPEKLKETFAAVCAKMHKKGEKIAASGQPADLCGFCESMGKLMQDGANQEEVKTAFGTITLITAKDPTVVKEIHDHAQRTQDEAKKLLATTN